jgi:hypothetical protein
MILRGKAGLDFNFQASSGESVFHNFYAMQKVQRTSYGIKVHLDCISLDIGIKKGL